MIEEIRVKNFAVIEDAVLKPGEGLNVITGETGAGKSVILEALAFLFAEIAGSREMLRLGTDRLEVWARLSVQKSVHAGDLRHLLESLELDYNGGEILIRRVFESGSGKSRAYLNDSPVAASTLKAVSQKILSLHTQGKTAELFTDAFALEAVDRWADHEPALEALKVSWQEMARVRESWAAHQERVNEIRSKMDFLKFQSEELDSPELSEQMIKRITEELPLWMSRESIAQTLSELRERISEGENAASLQISRACAALDKASQKLKGHAELEAIKGELSQALELAESSASRLEHLSASLDFDPAALEELLAAKAKIDRLMSKYKAAQLSELLERRDKVKAELDTLENAELQDAALKKDLKEKENAFLAAAAKISQGRRRAAAKMSKEMTAVLPEVGLPKAHFEVRLEEIQPGERGSEAAELLLAPNPGEGLKPLRLIASSGEASRLMLALLSLQAQQGAAMGGTLVFDEIEQGLSAQMTATVAKKLSELAKRSQIFAITHSPILASTASTHFYVDKRVSGGRTQSMIRILSDPEQRRDEALRLLGASNSKEKNMLKPYIESLFAVLVLTFLYISPVFAGPINDRPGGHVGIAIGAPTGLTVDGYMDRSNRIFGDLGVISDSLVIAAGWLHEYASFVEVNWEGVAMKTLLGAGFHAHLTEGERVGIGPVAQQEACFEAKPICMFLKVFPMVRFSPDSGFNLNANAGLTFRF